MIIALDHLQFLSSNYFADSAPGAVTEGGWAF
jgi:hypothetical protein